jgi:hypothetical protein
LKSAAFKKLLTLNRKIEDHNGRSDSKRVAVILIWAYDDDGQLKDVPREDVMELSFAMDDSEWVEVHVEITNYAVMAVVRNPAMSVWAHDVWNWSKELDSIRAFTQGV